MSRLLAEGDESENQIAANESSASSASSIGEVDNKNSTTTNTLQQALSPKQTSTAAVAAEHGDTPATDLNATDNFQPAAAVESGAIPATDAHPPNAAPIPFVSAPVCFNLKITFFLHFCTFEFHICRILRKAREFNINSESLKRVM